jgi:hypothetical protein
MAWLRSRRNDPVATKNVDRDDRAFLRRLDQIVKNRIADSDPEAIEARIRHMTHGARRE